ncbi:MAG: hypothetical protein JNK04_04360 [Myxococcales bacterium]|nr:hypothetical protein [Myxococcales bacterium]
MAEPIRFEYRYETRASIARAFRAMSDTDAFNKVAKGGMRFSHERAPDGTERAMGAVSKLGMTVRWEEEPFSFRAPHWFKTVRAFENGPAAKMTARAQFAALPNGNTMIAYQLEVIPRVSIFRPIILFDLKRTLEKDLRTAIEAVVTHLEQGGDLDPDASYAGPPPALKTAQAARLNALADRLQASALRDRLIAFIRAAPERDQKSMSPIGLAQAWVAPLENVAMLCVAAAHVGLLGVRIDLLCPACLVPKAAVDASGRLPEVHCESCNIRLDASYPEGLAVHFFPSPEVREIDIRMECLGSPAKTPQVVAQDQVAPRGEVNLATTLEPGTYQLRTLPLMGPPALLDVRDGEQNKDATFTVHGSIQPQLVRIRTEPASITVKNPSDRKVFVVLERLVPARRVLSLGRMLIEYPQLKDLLPAVGFISTMAAYKGVACSIRPADASEVPKIAASLPNARLTYTSDWVVLANYADIGKLERDLGNLDKTQLLVGVAQGTLSESTLGGRKVPMGPAVDEAYAAMCGTTFGVVARR